MSLFKDKILLITGGTGSFGNAVLKRFLDSDIKEIRIFSRDEKKQDDMRHHLQNKKVKFYIGDVRDKRSVDGVMNGVDYIFHAAALKQVPSCEFFPVQAVRTNVLGTENVLDSAIEHGEMCIRDRSTCDEMDFLTLDDYHWAIDDYGATHKAVKIGHNIISNVLNTFFRTHSYDEFDHIFFFSDHGHKLENEIALMAVSYTHLMKPFRRISPR